MNETTLSERRPLWNAMSDLFLDTDVRLFVPSLALTCADSPSDLAHLDRVFWGEVFPLAIPNLTQVAGEWASLDLDEGALIARAQRDRAPKLTRWLLGWMVRAEWEATKTLIVSLRALEPATRERLRADLSELTRCYFSDDASPAPAMPFADGAAAWALLKPVVASMLHKPERAARDAREARIATLIGPP